VVLGGGVAAAGDLLFGPIQAEVRKRVRTTAIDDVAIVPAALGTWAGAIGAAIHGAEEAMTADPSTPAGEAAMTGRRPAPAR
jgi:glucokinase